MTSTMQTPHQIDGPAGALPDVDAGVLPDVFPDAVDVRSADAAGVAAHGPVSASSGVDTGAHAPPDLQAVAAAHGLHAARDAADFVARIFAQVHPAQAELPLSAAATDAATAAQEACVPADGAAAEVPAAAPDTALDAAQWPGMVAPHLRGRPVLVLGLGACGLAMARWCARAGAQVTVADTRQAPPQLAALRECVPGAHFIAGPFQADLLRRCLGAQGDAQPVAPGQDAPSHALPAAVYVSPGLAPAQVQDVVDAARAVGLPVCAELDLFSAALHALGTLRGYRPWVLAITGTNGKTTVTSLTAHLLDYAGVQVAVAGNIGPTLLDTLAQALDAATSVQDLPQAWVLELSSFQLHGASCDGPGGFAPTAAVVLNVTQDHLDWHGSMSAYAAAKGRIYGTDGDGGLMVFNRDDELAASLLPRGPDAVDSPGRGARATGRRGAVRPPQRPRISFGADVPRRPGDFGLETVSGMTWLVRAHESDEPEGSTSTRARAGLSGSTQDAQAHETPMQRLMPADALRIRGRHNATNALAALALAQSTGCSLAALLHGLRAYRGEPHRVQPLCIVDGVEFFDDSKGTNVGATVAALTGLGAERRVVLIAGGLGKGQDFAALAAPVASYARAVVLIGQDASRMQAALRAGGCTDLPLLHAADMEQAVQQAVQQARSGDAVLLSPACASMDMFRDYAHRAEVFAQAVAAHAQSAGQPWLAGGDA